MPWESQKKPRETISGKEASVSCQGPKDFFNASDLPYRRVSLAINVDKHHAKAVIYRCEVWDWDWYFPSASIV